MPTVLVTERCVTSHHLISHCPHPDPAARYQAAGFRNRRA